MNANLNYFAEERQASIKNYIDDNKHVTVLELSNHFGVSLSTIRNDLTLLENKGLIHRTHGGAISVNSIRVNDETIPSLRRIINTDVKDEIAYLANSQVKDGDTIGIMAGTTTFAFAKTLANKEDLTIITSDLLIATWLDENTDHSIYMLSGFIRPKFQFVIPESASLEGINLDKIFFSGSGFDLKKGATVSDLNMAIGMRSIIQKATTAIFMCDSSKLGIVSFARTVGLEDIDVFITDNGINEMYRNEISSQEHITLLTN